MGRGPVYIEGESPNIRFEPNVAQEPITNKILSGIVRILGLTLYVTDGKVSQGDGSGVGSGEIRGALLRSYIFGNGFNNRVVAEGTFDELVPSIVNDLQNKDQIITKLAEYLVPMYETTDLFGNAIDWGSDFIFNLNDSWFFQKALEGYVSGLPAVFERWLGGLTNNLVDEVVQKLKQLETEKGQPIEDGIAFAHSGFFAPLLGAIQKEKFNIQTIINYEGPVIDSDAYIDNPYLKRIINVWGTAPNQVITGQDKDYPKPENFGIPGKDLTKMPVQVGDFGPPFIKKANFSGPNVTLDRPQGIENINIEIMGARHNDFAYRTVDENGNPVWNENPYEPERRAREINIKTNQFMRSLYKAALEDQINPGDLQVFLRRTPGITFDSAGQTWIVDPDQLVLVGF